VSLLEQVKEYAPGIPSKETFHSLPDITHPTTWEFGVHHHLAEKRGPHFDLRLGDPKTGIAHSWAMSDKWPAPGETASIIGQPSHTVSYIDFVGKIPKGTYGAGDVKLHDRAQVEVLNAQPGHITFNVYRGSGPEKYTLHQLQDRNWRLYNRTLRKEQMPTVPFSKPDYRSIDINKIPLEDPTHLMSAKIDDAHTLFVFPKGDIVRAISYRETDRPQGVIEHTPKVKGLFEKRVPAEIHDSVIRGGLYAVNPKTQEAVPSQILAGMLNANVWNSRGAQAIHGDLKTIIYDVVRFRGREMSKAPYEEKLEALKKVREAMPVFELPRTAQTRDEKERLLSDIKSGRFPATKEGVVLWPLKTGTPPIKAKILQEHDVYVRDFFKGEGKHEGSGVGGFRYSFSAKGPIVGRVGTGLSDALRKDMHENPDRYLGVVAKIRAMEKFPSGALRAPAMLGWHLDKNLQERLDQLEGR
jgi:hypothetical protein